MARGAPMKRPRAMTKATAIKKNAVTALKAKAPVVDSTEKDIFEQGGVKRRRCERRDSEEQRDRVIHDKFENYDPIAIANRKNDKGETIADCILDELPHEKTTGAHFKNKF